MNKKVWVKVFIGEGTYAFYFPGDTLAGAKKLARETLAHYALIPNDNDEVKLVFEEVISEDIPANHQVKEAC